MRGANRQHPAVMSTQQLLVLLGYFLIWDSPGALGSYRRSSSQCTVIPKSMALCYDIGYTEMRLPNLLDHDTVAEATQQSASWLPLLARECHPDARIFLCSLFAPICLDSLIYPCRSLCEAVRNSCAPVMACYGYPWPEILNCNKFPEDHELCISSITAESTSSKRIPQASCSDCELEEPTSAREILENFCNSDFAVKIRISRKNKTSAIADFDLDSKLEVLKHGPLLKTEAHTKLKRWLDLDATCVHNIMRGTNTGVYVITGEIQNTKGVMVNKAYAWHKKNRHLQTAVRRWRLYTCRT
ncbi:secreted frizzled-related protein 5-like isoform X2 [Paroedura picta]|uniref:secreted frizzled-related protein 5-like isoform X2 n=1 Tax=Paroedura picta TaxID=143630 RepID=UPI004056EB37